MPLTTKHRHVWTTEGCGTCGLTRGRASRIDGDLSTIERFIDSAEVQAALSKLDPVAYAITISGMRDAARKRHEAVIDKAVHEKLAADMAKLKAMATKTLKLTIPKFPKTTKVGTIKVDVSIADPTVTAKEA
jgi:hypothetical protein